MPQKRPEPAAEWMPIDKLVPWDKNPRDRQPVAEVAASIKKHGWAAPIVARKADNRIIAGHTRYKAALSLKHDKVPVRLIDVTVAQANELALADNKLSEIAVWESTLMAEIMADMEAQDVDIQALGFTEEEVARFLASGEEEEWEAIADTSDGAAGELTAPAKTAEGYSGFKMVQLYMSVEQHADFVATLRSLSAHFEADNATDTVVMAVLYAAKELKCVS